MDIGFFLFISQLWHVLRFLCWPVYQKKHSSLNEIFIVYQLQIQDRKIASLQAQVNDLLKENALKESEKHSHLQTIKMLQDKHRLAASDVSILMLLSLFTKTQPFTYVSVGGHTLWFHLNLYNLCLS